MDIRGLQFGSAVAPFAVALGIGLLIGIERERSKHARSLGTAGGVRTHAIVALLGAAAAQFAGTALVAVGGLVVGALAVGAYLRSSATDPGITSEVALFITYVLGVLAVQAAPLAAGCGVLVALLLAARSRLHEFIARRLTDQEILDGLLLAGAAFVVLPLMPDRAIDPFGVLNPRLVWRLTVLVLLVNGAGYVALRSLGPGRGLPWAGLFGGFVSSVATIAALGARVRDDASLARAGLAGAVLSCLATALQLALVLALVDIELLARMAWGIAAMAAVGMIWGGWAWRAAQAAPVQGTAISGRAFEPGHALLFAATVTLVTLAVALLQRSLGDAGAVVGVALGGFVDAHSATASAATLAASRELDSRNAVLGVLLAVSANSLTKLMVAFATGGGRWARSVAVPLAAMLAALVGGAVIAGA